MRYIFNLSLGFFLIFGLFVQVGFGCMCCCMPTCRTCQVNCTCNEGVTSCGTCECEECYTQTSCDSHSYETCDYCGNHVCECGDTTTQSKRLVSIYEGDTEATYYPPFGNASYKYKSNQDVYRRPYCGSSGRTTCNPYSLRTNDKYCGNWGKCSNGCRCEPDYCIGWCAHQAERNGVSFDGPEFANCGRNVVGDCSAHGDKYEADYETYGSYYTYRNRKNKKRTKPSGPYCTCSWCTIKNYYRCDSSQINDSHSCTSRNCAPDFVNGHNYCCPSGQCAHLGLDAEILNGGSRTKGAGIADPELTDSYCYSNGAVIQYQGDSLKCIDGMWNFITGNAEDFTDNCGKTISDFPLFYNLEPKYTNPYNPSGGYHNSYLVYPVSFPGKTKDVVAYIVPGEDFVKIGLSKTLYGSGTEGEGDQKISKQYKDTAVGTFSLLENIQGEKFDFHVDCYTPDGYECDHLEGECWPNSYCSQDNPSNIAYDETKYYCCPKGTCAHREVCYEEGGHKFNINGETCLWECRDEIWGKRDEGELCYRDCDCADSEDTTGNLFCKFTLYNRSDNICCPEGKCGLKTGVCVGKGEAAQSSEYNCVCQDGNWRCKNIIVEDKNSRILVSKDTNIYKTTLKLNTYLDEPAHVKIMVFFDKKNYNGNVKIIGTGDCDINKNIAIEEKNNIFEGLISSGDYTCELEISAPGLLDNQYFFYTGSALILRYTALELDPICGDGIVEGIEECESTDLSGCVSPPHRDCDEITCSVPPCTCNYNLKCDGSTCAAGSDDYSEYCTGGEDGEGTFDGTCSCEGDGYEKYTVGGDTIYVDCANDVCWTPVLRNAGGTELKFWSDIKPYGTSNCKDLPDCSEMTIEDEIAECEDIREGCDEENYNLKDSCIGIADRPACNYCENLDDYGGFDDWVLPDKDILTELCNSNTCLGGACFDDPYPNTYWSSTEADSSTSYFMDCVGTGNIQIDYKNTESSIRCVRRPPETDCSNGIDDDLDGEIDYCDTDCGYSGCSCGGTGYCVKNLDGDEVYIDCNTNKCWTPTDFTGYIWGGYDINKPSCIGGGSDYQACNHCDKLKYGGQEDWVLPSKDIMVGLRGSELYNDYFGSDNNYYWSSTQYDSNNSYAVFFGECDYVCASYGGITTHINKTGITDYNIIVSCIRG
ncbi:MAG: hypothetical protein KAT28_04795 [Candidatus Aenigmarchaeota archaeon]|nr:hypothetical protein [Candidatus Aenigmarchaeota archaeon]